MPLLKFQKDAKLQEDQQGRKKRERDKSGEDKAGVSRCFELRLLATFSASNSHGTILASAQKGGKGRAQGRVVPEPGNTKGSQ